MIQSRAFTLNAAVLLLTALAGLALTITAGGWKENYDDKTLLNGTRSKALETDLEKAFPIRQAAINAWGSLEFSVFGNGRKGVLVGSEGWFYSSEEFERPKNFDAEIADKLEYVTQVKTALENAGVKLAVVLVPAKARVYPEHLGRYSRPKYWDDVYSKFLSGLQAKGVIAPDLLNAMKSREGLFLKTDTHWTPVGARVAAQVLSQAVKPLLEFQTKKFNQKPGKREPHAGDLLKFIPLTRWGTQPTPDTLETPMIEGTESGSTGLFGDSQIEVALVGTSYSANPKFNFDGALKLELQADVLNLALEGKGPITPMQEFLKTLKDNPVKLVIWEIPERFLPVAYPEQK
jgi:alginate O-acetyltransferase complex protein AlgJ